MELYSALLAITILSLTSTMGVSGECTKGISPKSGLDKAKYYSGTWYVTHYLDLNPQGKDPFCSSFAPRESGGNKVTEKIYHYKTNKKQKIYHIGDGTLESSGAKYTAKYTTVDRSGTEIGSANEKYSYILTVMEADDSSALLHICLQKDGNDLGDLYTFANKQKTGQPSVTVQAALGQRDLQFSQFSPTRTLECEYDDQFTSKKKTSFYNIGEGKLGSSGVQYTAKYNTVDNKGSEIKAANDQNSYTLTVLEADDTSALVHICLREGPKDLGDLYTVLSHKKDAEPNENVKSALTQAGLELSEFVATKDLGCQYDDQFISL